MEQAMTSKPSNLNESTVKSDVESAAAAAEEEPSAAPAKDVDTSTVNSKLFHFFTIDPNERLPRPAPPTNTRETPKYNSVVTWAISSKHENAPSTSESNPANKEHILEAARTHTFLTSLLKSKSDPDKLHGILHALLTSNHGREFHRLLSHPKEHAQLIHLLMRFDPFVPGLHSIASLKELENIRTQRRLQHPQRNAENTHDTESARVQIQMSSIVIKEHTEYIKPAKWFLEYDMADVHLYLIVCLVSNNSLLGVSAVRAVWKLLTDFGVKWMNDREEQKKKNRAKLLLLRRHADSCTPPPAKRRCCEANGSSTDSHVEDEVHETPEGLKLVPGMNGLCVDFVKEHFFLNAEEEEDICSDRLPRGRVKRLLLALLNIFRLNHRSKNDLLHEMTTNFPHYKTSPPALHRWYIHMCLQMVHLVSTLEGPVMNLLVDQALEMDVQIKISDKGTVFLDETEEDDDEEQQLNASSTQKRSYQIISHENILSVGKSNNNLGCSDDSDEIAEIAERLDNLMNILCQRIDELTTFAPDSVSEALAAVVNARRLYRHLDDIFDKKVRNTHRSKFVPFIFFVLFGKEHDALDAVGKLMAERNDMSPSNVAGLDTLKDRNGEVNEVIAAPISQTDFLYRDFCAKLIDLFYNPVEAGELPSQTLVCTLASFVSRATYVCAETVCETVAAILQWAEAYIEAHSESKGTPALVRRQSSGLGNTKHQRDIHALFYTACQSAFYIMCFRGAEALHYYNAAWRQRDNPESEYASPESVNLGAKRWKAICQHPLQPLKYCLESVRVEFLHMAEDLHLFVEESTGDDSMNQEEEAKKFIQQLWSANDQKANGDKSKTVTPKRKRSSIISTAATQEKKRMDGGVGGLGKGSNPLDSYFPFDPYLLQSSYNHVHPFYRNWEDCILTMDELEGAPAVEGGVVDEEVLVQGGGNESDDDDGSALTDSGDEQEDGDDEESDDDESKSNPSPVNSKTLEGSGLEVEIRRCRAMSTGSQASW